jgi:Cu/Ag efflux pump CusA
MSILRSKRKNSFLTLTYSALIESVFIFSLGYGLKYIGDFSYTHLTSTNKTLTYRTYRDNFNSRSCHCDLVAAIEEGALQRIRPKIMTVAVIVAGLLPILWGQGSGSEIMSRIAVPMIGDMLSAPLLSLLVLPAAYLLARARETTPSIKVN